MQRLPALRPSSETADTRPGASRVGAHTSPMFAVPRGSNLNAVAVS